MASTAMHCDAKKYFNYTNILDLYLHLEAKWYASAFYNSLRSGSRSVKVKFRKEGVVFDNKLMNTKRKGP